MREKVNHLCNVVYGADSQSRDGLPQITVPQWRLRFDISEAKKVAEQLLQAVAVAECSRPVEA